MAEGDVFERLLLAAADNPTPPRRRPGEIFAGDIVEMRPGVTWQYDAGPSRPHSVRRDVIVARRHTAVRRGIVERIAGTDNGLIALVTFVGQRRWTPLTEPAARLTCVTYQFHVRDLRFIGESTKDLRHRCRTAQHGRNTEFGEEGGFYRVARSFNREAPAGPERWAGEMERLLERLKTERDPRFIEILEARAVKLDHLLSIYGSLR
jgi:hypothetical protein